MFAVDELLDIHQNQLEAINEETDEAMETSVQLITNKENQSEVLVNNSKILEAIQEKSNQFKQNIK